MNTTRTRSVILFLIPLFCGCLFLLSCRSAQSPKSETTEGKTDPGRSDDPSRKEEPGRKDEPGRTDEPSKTDEVFQENQPDYPEPGDDPFFLAPAPKDVVFRVLITEGNYQIRQMAERENILRKKDVNADRDQVKVFKKFSDRYNFNNFDFEGILVVRLNPHSGEIELAKFAPGHTPRAWQVTTYLKDDVSRMAFSFPKQRVTLREFRVQYLWRIRRPAGMTPEEARKRVIEFLKEESEKK